MDTTRFKDEYNESILNRRILEREWSKIVEPARELGEGFSLLLRIYEQACVENLLRDAADYSASSRKAVLDKLNIVPQPMRRRLYDLLDCAGYAYKEQQEQFDKDSADIEDLPHEEDVYAWQGAVLMEGDVLQAWHCPLSDKCREAQEIHDTDILPTYIGRTADSHKAPAGYCPGCGAEMEYGGERMAKNLDRIFPNGQRSILGSVDSVGAQSLSAHTGYYPKQRGNVRYAWKCADCIDGKVTTFLEEYLDKGIPVCPECGEDLYYFGVEVKALDVEATREKLKNRQAAQEIADK